MSGPKEVLICPACKRYLPIDEAEGKPVCRTEDCEREGMVLNRMHMCPACEKCFASKQEVKAHGQQQHQ